MYVLILILLALIIQATLRSSSASSIKTTAFSPDVRALIPDWVFQSAKPTTIAALPAARRDITKVSPSAPSLETLRISITSSDVLKRRCELERLRGTVAASSLSDTVGLRISELHHLLRDYVPDYAEQRSVPDLKEAMGLKISSNEMCMQWLLPMHREIGSEAEATLLLCVRMTDTISGMLKVPVNTAAALHAELQDLQVNEHQTEVRKLVFFCRETESYR